AYAGPARLRTAGAYLHATVLDPVGVGGRSRASAVCGRAAAWPRDDGAARQDGPEPSSRSASGSLRCCPSSGRRSIINDATPLADRQTTCVKSPVVIQLCKPMFVCG